MRLILTSGGRRIAASLAESGTARDFASLLPLTIPMDDLFGREKYGRLPRALSTQGRREDGYAVGQIVYWSPGPDVAIFYRHDGQAIPDPGIIVLGTVEGDVGQLDRPGAMTVTIERDE